MKLNIGCGNKRKEGFLGVDKFRSDASDIVADLEERLPFEESSINEIWMDNLIEHIRDIPNLMKEIHRICINGAKVTIFTPHFSSLASWRDPTHFHHLSYFSMNHFEKKDILYCTGGGFKVIDRKLAFGGILGNIGRLIFMISPREYESNWCFVFRASTLKFVLEVIKKE